MDFDSHDNKLWNAGSNFNSFYAVLNSTEYFYALDTLVNI